MLYTYFFSFLSFIKHLLLSLSLLPIAMFSKNYLFLVLKHFSELKGIVVALSGGQYDEYRHIHGN